MVRLNELYVLIKGRYGPQYDPGLMEAVCPVALPVFLELNFIAACRRFIVVEYEVNLLLSQANAAKF